MPRPASARARSDQPDDRGDRSTVVDGDRPAVGDAVPAAAGDGSAEVSPARLAGGRATARRGRPRGQRRELIMQRATELFQERGFHGTGIDDIGRAAGVSGPAVYRHFKSKDGILLAILEQALDDLAAVIERARMEGGDAATQLEHFVRTQAGFAVGSPHVIDLLAKERNHLPMPDRSRVVRKQRLNRAEWMHVISEARPDLLDSDVRLRLYGIVGLFRDMVTAPVREVDRRELVEVMTRMVLAAVYA